jgi:hypothetical protein
MSIWQLPQAPSKVHEEAFRHLGRKLKLAKGPSPRHELPKHKQI